MTRLTSFIGISTILILSMSSCSKDDPAEDNTPTPTTKSLEMMFHHEWDGQMFNLNQVYNVAGVDVKFNEIRYYLSGFNAMSDDMEANDYGDKVLLVDAGMMSTQTVGNITLPHLHMFSFNIGLDADLNHQDPTVADAPLNDINMHWSWNPDAGYKFVKIEGESDPNGDGIFEAFSIHVATDALLRNVNIMVHEDVESNTLTLHTHIALNTWFANVNFNDLQGTHGDGVTTNAVMDGAVTSFTIE